MRNNNQSSNPSNPTNPTNSKNYVFTLNVSKNASTKPGVLAYVHNGAIKRRLDASSYWLEFRLISNKNGEVPLTTPDGRSLSTAEFVKRLSGDPTDDIVMSVELPTDLGDEWDSSWGSLTVSFSAEDLRVGRETEYKGAITQYFHLEGAEIQLHREVMRPKIDPSILDGFEGTAKSSNVVTAEQLHSKAAARKRKREAAAAARATAAAAANPDTATTTQAAATAATASKPAADTEWEASNVDIDDLLN
ncbi:hypothetical protein AVV41_gp066 [Microcystis phage MaMV-DC]|uniref:Uncharacterized protein n=1 Tax=Microcystis phage MaMV-DC TaxID=1357715 RepID=A0A075BS09_9CAUD|nr:hypothetical protein AVV41_gp066 [Microcystis phage MaMV-DC]AGR48631.1 hypothetical protein MaMVDC_66 [Microcystis phage MaMV-DC]